MNQNGLYQTQVSGMGCWLFALGAAFLLGAVGLGWIVKSFLFLLGIAFLAPVVLFFVGRWWLNRNLVQGACPVCSAELTGLNQMELQCPNCGESLKVEAGSFSRLTPPGTIDVKAVEVSAQVVED